MKYKYLLVLQFPESLMDFEEMLELEDSITTALPEKAILDGHDIGSGEINYFIFTDDPEGTFKAVCNKLDTKIKENVRTAYRETKGKEYVILWPKSLKKFIVK